MQQRPHIQFRNFGKSKEIYGLYEDVLQQVDRLERFFPRVVGCDVMVEAPKRSRHRHGSPYTVRVDVQVPGQKIIVDRHDATGGVQQDVRIAIHDTFRTTARRLQEYAEMRRRRHVSRREVPLTKPEVSPSQFDVI